jgi:hypothetical protein
MRRVAASAALAAAVVVATATAAAPKRVTISANHAVMEDGVPLLLRGNVSSGHRGERVTIEQDDCGPIPWHPLRTVRTGDGGGWVSYAAAEESIRLHARWRGTVSRTIRVGVRPDVTLSGVFGSLHVLIHGYDWFGGKQAVLQTVAGGRWKTVATTTLVKRGAAGQYAQTVGTFTKEVGHGLFRAVLPTGSAAPCYVAGYSPTLRL